MDRIIMAPKGVPQDRIDILRGAFKKLYKDKTFKRLIKALGENMNQMDGPAYDKLRIAQSKEYGALVKKLTAN